MTLLCMQNNYTVSRCPSELHLLTLSGPLELKLNLCHWSTIKPERKNFSLVHKIHGLFLILPIKQLVFQLNTVYGWSK